MAGIDVESGGKRGVSADINMVPFIDLLLVTVAFLLITAVWSQAAQLNATTQVPSGDGGHTGDAHVFDVRLRENVVELAWKQGNVVVHERMIARGSVSDMAKVFEEEWRARGEHKDARDMKLDIAVLHADNTVPFKEMAEVLDALSATKREMAISQGRTAVVPVFATTLAAR
jgi:biopolymer transport protein ExbD